jgi:hypothetical protein
MDMANLPEEGGIDGVRPVVDRLAGLSGAEKVAVRDIVGAFGDTSFLPLMMIPALLVVSPLSGIPLFSSLCGLSIALVAVQMLAGRDHLWLPGIVMRRQIAGERLSAAAARLERIADWLDRHSRKRLHLLFRAPMVLLPQMLCVLCGLAMPFLELLPFSSSLLGMAVLLISVGFLVRDGVYTLAGLVFIFIAASIPFAVAESIAG